MENRHQFVVSEALARLDRKAIVDNPERLAALKKSVDSIRGTTGFLELIEKFDIPGYEKDLLGMAQADPESATAVRAIRVLLSKKRPELLASALDSGDEKRVEGMLKALGSAEDPRSVAVLMKYAADEKRPIDLRRAAIRAVARTRPGTLKLLALAEKKQLDPRLHETASAAVHLVGAEEIRKRADKVFPVPPSLDSTPMPPIRQLAKRSGDARKGEVVFANVGTCAKCHIVNGKGKEVGPNLSEIGTKLGRLALFESILFPSAGISHNFAASTVQLRNGNVATGIVVSRTPEQIAVRGIDAITRTYPISEVEEVSEQTVSLMPADLNKLMTIDDLVNVVEYLTTLKTAASGTAQVPGTAAPTFSTK